MADPQYAEKGLSKLAHAIRRSTALTVARDVTPADSTIEQMLEVADQLAAWIGGAADAEEQNKKPWAGPN